MSVLNEEEFQVNNKADCSFHDNSYNSNNEIPSTFSNEIPPSVLNGFKSTIEVQQCDEDLSNSVVTFDRVVS